MSKKNRKNRGNGSEDKIETAALSAVRDENENDGKDNDETKEIEAKNEENAIEVTSIVTEEIEIESEVEDQSTISQLDKKAETQKTIKNLISVVILLAGIAVGSFFVDIVQFISGDGFSKKALNSSEVLVAGDRTWVAFDQPAVDVKVLTVGEDEMAECKGCDPSEVLVWLRDYIPTMVVTKVDATSEEGKSLIEAHKVKSLPAFFFSDTIEETKFFQGEGAVVFEKKNDSFMLNAAGLGIPVGKYLQTPEVDETDAILGSRDARVKVVVFSDFQCPYCGEYFNNVKEAVESFDENQVALVYKDLPLDFHLQGKNSSMAARCAQDQGKFWEMGALLYSSQDKWSETEGVASFKGYARDLNLDANKFNSCIDEGTFSELIEKDLNQASEIGVTGTPATFVGTQFSSGVIAVDEIKAMIEKELAENGENGESTETAPTETSEEVL
jgi:protein-disulfide isomerase